MDAQIISPTIMDRPAWQALADAAGTPNPFYAPAAVAACAALPGAGTPDLLVVGPPQAPLGLLPIAVQRTRGVAVCIENWATGVRALGEPLVRAGQERAFWQAALPLLARGSGHWLRLSALDADSASTLALTALLAGQGRALYRTRDYGRAVLLPGLSAEEHARTHIRGKVLKEQRRLRARLDEQGGLAFDRLAPGAPVDPWIDDLFRLELTGWKGRDGVAAAADPHMEACFRAILRAAHAQGALDFHRMRVGDAVIAMLANLESGGEAFQLKIAHDEAWAASSPGVLIEMAYLAHALDVAKLARVDSCARAGHPMIDRLWPARRRIVSLAVPFPTLASRLACYGVDRWRHRRSHARQKETA